MAFVRWNQDTQIWEVAVNPEAPGTLFNHLPVSNPTLPLDIANKQYVDAAAAGAGFVPYNGANQTVNLNSQVFLTSGHVTLFGNAGSGYYQSALEIQAASPRISFHMPGIVASQIGMDSSGIIRTYNNPGNGYENFACAALVANGILSSAGQYYPGRLDAPTGVQSNWYLASHGNWGLYINTGLFVTSQIYGNTYGVMDPNYLLRETTPTDFTVAPGGGSFTISTHHAAYYMRHNGFLYLTWFVDANWPNSMTYCYFTIPGGFIPVRYANSVATVITNGFPQSVRIEAYPNDPTLYAFMNNANVMGGSGRFSGQIVLFVG